ncbi:hypothetical protein [Draconibacterium orientale]|uniref:hypothetical protein n=1 Tax=Draconibacterium orientale TaxID=1168034 RepID=UPI0029C02A77|nr:hypothetical protein [Draconibacterium orientale]
MEDTHFYNILEYFSTPISINKGETDYLVGGNLPLSDYYRYSMKVASRYIGECNRNIETYKESPDFMRREFSNEFAKLCQVYKDEFGVEYNTGQTINVEMFVSSDIQDSEGVKRAYDIKLGIYVFVMTYIEKQRTQMLTLPNEVKKERVRSKASRFDFILSLTEGQFREVHDQMIRLKLIHKESSISDFINCFSGKTIKNKIVWIGGYYRLALFIRQINKRGCFRDKVYDGIWEIVSDLFVPHNEPYFDPKKLKHSSSSANTDYTPIAYLVDEIEEMLSPEYEE